MSMRTVVEAAQAYALWCISVNDLAGTCKPRRGKRSSTRAWLTRAAAADPRAEASASPRRDTVKKQCACSVDDTLHSPLCTLMTQEDFGHASVASRAFALPQGVCPAVATAAPGSWRPRMPRTWPVAGGLDRVWRGEPAQQACTLEKLGLPSAGHPSYWPRTLAAPRPAGAPPGRGSPCRRSRSISLWFPV